MKVVSDLSDAALDTPSVLSIGNFDGLHLGHARILKTVVEQARRYGVQSAAMTFDPHPIQVLAPDKAPRLISTLLQKLRLLESTGIDLLFVARFDSRFGELTPESFIRRYIVEGFHAKAICVGNNFTFGQRQAGTVATLRKWSSNFDVIEIAPVSVRGTVASSTHIRRLVHAGLVSRACRLLGRWFEIEGRIVSGEGRGRQVTVPTLNLAPDNDLLPGNGVYITRIALDGRGYLEGVTNIGTRPTFNGTALSIETFVLDAPVPQNAAAGRIQFLKRLRAERRFDSPELLRQQIGRDVRSATRFFRLLGMNGPQPIHVEIYSRPGCHLCDDAKLAVQRFVTRYPIRLTVTDVDRTEALRARFGSEIPVVFINGEEAFRHRVNEIELERTLTELCNRSIS
jgi:riboflavin kinase/FMN adenylyltransferase